MSVNLMSAIFRTEFFDLKDENGDTTKASTAKLILLSMADCANDEGEGAYPSVETLCRKTALSAQTIRNTFDALRFNGIIELAGLSKWGTNNHTINTKSFPKAIGKEVTYLTLYPLDPLIGEATPSSQSLDPLYPLDPIHSLTTINPPYIDVQSEKKEQEPKPTEKNLLDGMLDMANYPGAKREARVAAILDYAGKRLNKNTTSKAWREFAKNADTAAQERGEKIDVFFNWLLNKPKFDPDFWPPTKMWENWPGAFGQSENKPSEDYTGGKSFHL